MTGGLARRVSLDAVVPVMNVTPLVDVVLVLLIIFMVVAPQLHQDVSVDLPGIFNSDPDTASGDPFKVTVQRAGEFHFQGQRYDLDGLVATLEAEHTTDPLRRLVLRADAALRYADVRTLQDRLREIGFPGMSFMVNERHRREAPDFGGSMPADAATPAVETGATGSVETPMAGLDSAVPASPAPASDVTTDEAQALATPAGVPANGAQPWE